eukprot:CAMPEP_0114654628 /NCGR_PEP_ID=MMETSP0191-20121206/10591_1 /TAXON_ID=126664 /ORGANISM="Sorites sp." /LENGTH=318 /DNA_ID=CAMNT_0001870147 /DNA_START=292 /DNA_END=1245 /DNA_ORIENTATION=-
MSEDAEHVLFDAMREISSKTRKHIVALKYDFSGADWNTVYKLLPDYTFLLENTSKNKDIKRKQTLLADEESYLYGTKTCKQRLCCCCTKKSKQKNSKDAVKSQSNAKPLKVAKKMADDVELEALNITKNDDTTSEDSDPPLSMGHIAVKSMVINASRFGVFESKDPNDDDDEDGFNQWQLQPRTQQQKSTELTAIDETKTQNDMAETFSPTDITRNESEVSQASQPSLLRVESTYDTLRTHKMSIQKGGKRNESFLKELEKRILHIMKAIFMERFENGLTSNNAMMLMEEYIDSALDHNDVGLLGCKILKQFSVGELW